MRLVPIVAVVALATPVLAQELPEESREMLALFSRLDLPDVKGKELVVFNTGRWSDGSNGFRFFHASGWVIERTETRITLLDDSLGATTLPIVRKLPDEWEKIEKTLPRDVLLPGETRSIDFSELGKKLLAGDEELPALQARRLGYGGRLALLAHWAQQRGEDELARNLIAKARATLTPSRRDEGRAFDKLADELASALRVRAIVAAHHRKPLVDVLAAWKIIASRLPQTKYTDKAAELVREYERLIAAAMEPRLGIPGFGTPSPEVQAALCVEAFLEASENPGSDPGFTDLVHPWSEWGVRGERAKRPGEELVALGWAALPTVIAHLDDLRPTRSISWGRSFCPSSYELLRVADACQQVFEEITGVDLYEHAQHAYVVEDGRVAEAVAFAKTWWAEHHEKGPRAHYEVLVAKAPLSSALRASRRLLALDPGALPLVLDRISSSQSAERQELLYLVEDKLGREHEAFLEKLLEDRNPEVAVRAACLLWEQASSDRGLRRCVEVIESWKKEDDRFGTNIARAFWLLGAVGRDDGIDAIARFIVGSPSTVRHVAIERGAWIPQRKIAEALVAVFGDRTGTAYNNKRGDEWIENRFCDEAAASFAKLLGRDFSYYDHSYGERDAAIAALEVWWKENRETIDWKVVADSLKKRE